MGRIRAWHQTVLVPSWHMARQHILCLRELMFLLYNGRCVIQLLKGLGNVCLVNYDLRVLLEFPC